LKKKILIIGSSSGIGYYLLKNLNKINSITGWTSKKKRKGSKYINFKKNFFLNQIKNYNYIIYCSSISKYKKCEKKKQLSKFVNIKILQKIISKLNKKQKLIFFSSYAVKSKFLKKDPLYIKHKKLGESLIKKKTKNYFIIRPAKIVESFELLLSKSRIKRFKFYVDRYIHITSYKLIIDAVEKILIKDLTGILNLASIDKISYLDLAKKITNKKKLESAEYQENKYSFLEPLKIVKNRSFNSFYKYTNDIIKNVKIRNKLSKL
jgi:dTDP-4-dehydrorhamnose reductase